MPITTTAPSSTDYHCYFNLLRLNDFQRLNGRGVDHGGTYRFAPNNFEGG